MYYCEECIDEIFKRGEEDGFNDTYSNAFKRAECYEYRQIITAIMQDMSYVKKETKEKVANFIRENLHAEIKEIERHCFSVDTSSEEEVCSQCGKEEFLAYCENCIRDIYDEGREKGSEEARETAYRHANYFARLRVILSIIENARISDEMKKKIVYFIHENLPFTK